MSTMSDLLKPDTWWFCHHGLHAQCTKEFHTLGGIEHCPCECHQSQQLPEQPAREGDEEWHVEQDPIHGCSVVTKGRIVAAGIYRREDAERIVTDHARAALVPRLVAALRYLDKVSERQAVTDADDSDTVNLTVTVGWLRKVTGALAVARKSGVE